MAQEGDARDDASREQIRRRMLTIARLDGAQHQHHFVPAANFLRATDDHGVAIASEAEGAELLGELLAWGLLEEEAGVDLGGSRKAFRHRRLKLTKKGWSLWMQEIPPVPGVADERLGD